MPLGKLSKQQIAKGFDVLNEMEEALKRARNTKQLEELSSKFYTIIPHDFGRNRPPVIDTPEVLQAKKDMLLVSVLRNELNSASLQLEQVWVRIGLGIKQNKTPIIRNLIAR